MNTDTELISIVLPTYNGARTIGRAIESVQAQTYASWELLVLNDGFTDTTAEVVQTYAATDPRIRHLPNAKNLGLQKNLNVGLRAAKGPYIARIDDDDRWIDTGKLAAQLAFFKSHPDHVLVGTGVVMCDEAQVEQFRYLVPETDAQIRARLLSKNCFIHSSVMFKKDAALRIGGYEEAKEALHIEDYDMWLRMGLEGKLANLPLYAVGYTMRAGSISSTHKMEQFRKNITVMQKYRDAYPGYFGALMRGYARIVLYGFFGLVPLASLKTKLLRLYYKKS